MRLALGTAQFGFDYGVSNRGGRTPADEVRAILDCAADGGVTLLDTAPAYGDAETVLAEARVARRGFRVVTKTLPLSHGLEAVVAAVQRSADRFGEALDTVLVHAAGDLFEREGAALWSVLQDFKHAGLTRRVGASVYATDPIRDLAARFAPDVMQLPASLFDQRLIEDDTVATLAAQGVEVHARSLLHQGLIFADPDRLPPALRCKRAEIARWQGRVAASGQSPLSLALSFVAAVPGIHTGVVGVTCRAELAAILAALRDPWPGLDPTPFRLTDPLLLSPPRWT